MLVAGHVNIIKMGSLAQGVHICARTAHVDVGRTGLLGVAVALWRSLDPLSLIIPVLFHVMCQVHSAVHIISDVCQLPGNRNEAPCPARALVPSDQRFTP